MYLVMDTTVIPGDRLHPISTHNGGTGTYVHGTHIYASIVGDVTVVAPKAGSAAGTLPCCQVQSRQCKEHTVPVVGSTITGTIGRINPRFAKVSLVTVGNRLLTGAFSGVIRQVDVRATEVDKVVMYKSFRPGDIVRAEVISLGDSRSYYLSTAKNSLGVISARSEAGHAMVPVSWQEMQCPLTKLKEFRKVAKVQA